MYSKEREEYLSKNFTPSREKPRESIADAMGATSLLQKFSKLSVDKKSQEKQRLETNIFREQKSIESMVQSIIGDMVNSAESQGRVNVSAKYDQYKKQMETAKKEMKKLKTQFNYLI